MFAAETPPFRRSGQKIYASDTPISERRHSANVLAYVFPLPRTNKFHYAGSWRLHTAYSLLLVFRGLVGLKTAWPKWSRPRSLATAPCRRAFRLSGLDHSTGCATQLPVWRFASVGA